VKATGPKARFRVFRVCIIHGTLGESSGQGRNTDPPGRVPPPDNSGASPRQAVRRIGSGSGDVGGPQPRPACAVL